MTSPAKAEVTVVLEPSKDPPFKLKSSLIQGKNLTFKNNNFPGFYIYFTLEDPENSGYLFPSDPLEAFAAKQLPSPTGPCPNQDEAWDQLVPETVSSDYKTLTVRNYNSYSADFGFSLFVTKDPEGSGPYLALDPIGSNQNGPTNSRFFLSPAVLVGAIVAIVIILFAAYELGFFAH